jgi:hypothetical protein
VTRPTGQIKVRVYTPEGPGPFPVHINYHGGKSASLQDQDMSLIQGQEDGFWAVSRVKPPGAEVFAT